MAALAANLTDADAALRVPACPGWAVRDVIAHLAGACTDSLAGPRWRMAWTVDPAPYLPAFSFGTFTTRTTDLPE